MVRSNQFFGILFTKEQCTEKNVRFALVKHIGSSLVVTFIHNLNILGSPSFRIHQNRLTIGCFIIQHADKVSK